MILVIFVLSRYIKGFIEQLALDLMWVRIHRSRGVAQQLQSRMVSRHTVLGLEVHTLGPRVVRRPPHWRREYLHWVTRSCRVADVWLSYLLPKQKKHVVLPKGNYANMSINLVIFLMTWLIIYLFFLLDAYSFILCCSLWEKMILTYTFLKQVLVLNKISTDYTLTYYMQLFSWQLEQFL